MTIFGGILLYLGLACTALGLASLLKPLRFVGIRKRRGGLMVLCAGFLLFATGIYLPVSEARVQTPRTRLDEFAPVYQFNEVHSIAIDAPGEQVYRATRTVCPGEIRFFKTLMRLRFPTKELAAEDQPILASFTNGAFVLLAEDPGREIVIGRGGNGSGGRTLAADEFKSPHSAPHIQAVMNFHIQDVDATHCLLTTETRVYALGPDALRGFATYWRMIYPGSGLIRRMWLRAIKLRAQSPK